MTLKLVSAFVAILLASHAICQNLRPSAVVPRDQLYQITYNQMPVIETWEDTKRRFLEGKGCLIGRELQVKNELMEANRRFTTPDSKTKHILKQLRWDSADIIPEVFLGSREILGNRYYSQALMNEYPYQLAPRAEHWLLWFRTALLPPAIFETSGKERALHNYILNFEFYGSYGLDSVPSDIREASFSHPPGYAGWKDPDTGYTVNREDALEALQRARPSINAHIQHFFPEKDYQVLWNRSPERYKSLSPPDHFHVIVYPKV